MVLCALLLALPAECPAQNPVLESMSDKNLFKKADVDFAAGRLEDARLAIQVAIRKKKKPDKKYEDLLVMVNAALADKQADAGGASCAKMDLDGCQKRIAAAKEFAQTEKVTRLEATFNSSVAKLRQEFQGVIAQADGGDPEAALPRLAELQKFKQYLPTLGNEATRVHGLFLQKLVDEGNRHIENHLWEQASLRFQRVLSIDAKNAQAATGRDKADRGRRAYLASARAGEFVKTRNYDEALTSLDEALQTYPESKSEFQQSRKEIAQAYIAMLLEDIPIYLKKIDKTVTASRDAYLSTQKVLELDPGNQTAAGLLEESKKHFIFNWSNRASELADIQDLSRIATATVIKFDIQRLSPEAIRQEDMKFLLGNFNKKRVSQLVLSVEDMASAPPEFVNTVQTRARGVIDRQGWRDLRIRGKDDYEKNPGEDPQFAGLLPDGKSYTAFLTLSVTKFDFRRNVVKSGEARSRYVVGTEKVPNPEYEALAKQYDIMLRAVRNPAQKKDKPTKEGWTELTLQEKKDELNRTDKTLEKDKVVEYGYQQAEYRQSTDIEVEISLRDSNSKEIIAQEKIPYHVELTGQEVTGVRDRDLDGRQNLKLRLPEKDEALAEASRVVREELDKRLPLVLQQYTYRFYNEGEKAFKAGRIEEAVESYLCHWAFYRNKLDPAQMLRISDIVKRETAFELAKHGEKLMEQLLTVPVTQ